MKLAADTTVSAGGGVERFSSTAMPEGAQLMTDKPMAMSSLPSLLKSAKVKPDAGGKVSGTGGWNVPSALPRRTAVPSVPSSTMPNQGMVSLLISAAWIKRAASGSDRQRLKKVPFPLPEQHADASVAWAVRRSKRLRPSPACHRH